MSRYVLSSLCTVMICCMLVCACVLCLCCVVFSFVRSSDAPPLRPLAIVRSHCVRSTCHALLPRLHPAPPPTACTLEDCPSHSDHCCGDSQNHRSMLLRWFSLSEHDTRGDEMKHHISNVDRAFFEKAVCVH